MNLLALLLSAFAGFQLIGAMGGLVTIVMRRKIFGSHSAVPERDSMSSAS